MYGGGGGEAEIGLGDGSVLAFTSVQNQAMQHGVIGGKGRAGAVPAVRYVSNNRDIAARDLGRDSARWRLLVETRTVEYGEPEGEGGESAAGLGRLLLAHEEMEFAWMRPWMEQSERHNSHLPVTLFLKRRVGAIFNDPPSSCRARSAILAIATRIKQGASRSYLLPQTRS